MRSNPSVAYATRLQASEAELIEEVKQEMDWTDAKLVRRSIRYYLDKNPDHIGALFPADSLDEFTRDLVE